jgi:hypothetical protein
VGGAIIVEDVELKRAMWKPAHDRWNPGGPEDPATVFARLSTDRRDLERRACRASGAKRLQRRFASSQGRGLELLGQLRRGLAMKEIYAPNGL